MKRIRIVAFLFSAILAGNAAQAQEVLTLSEAVKFALENKAEAKKAKLDIENAQYQIDEVRAGALPQITGNGSLTYNPIIQQSVIDFSGQSQVIKMGQPWTSAATLGVSQQIFNQSLFTGLKAAKTTKEFYAINNTLTDEQLIEKVSNSYYEVFQSQLQLKTLQTNLANTVKTRNIIQGLVDAGLAKKIDLDRTTVAINNLESQKQQLLNVVELRENALKFAIGMEIQQEVTLPSETFQIDYSKVVEATALDSRTEIQVLQKQTELLELNKKAMVSEYYPSLSFSGNIGYYALGSSFPIFGGSEITKTPGSALGLNLSIPIFNGGKTKARISQADISIRKAMVDIEDTKLGLSLANENAKTQIKNSLLVINSNENNVKLAKDVLDNTQNNYRNGLATLTELLDAENAYADAQNNLTTSLLNYKVAEVQLIKANGNLKSIVTN